MKCTIPEISWHNRDPILSVDVQQNSNDRFIRLATAGADYHVLIWQVLIDECGKTNLEAISDLTRHQRPVNIVRWSPSGQYLASGDDDSNIIIWQLKTDNIPSLDGETNDKETWIVYKILRGHKEDVYDLCWSPDNLKLVSGSIDNTAIIWNLGKGKNEHIFAESKGFVQGVCWDPKNQYIALLSSDRVCRVADCVTKQIKWKSFKGHLPVPESHSLYEKDVKYFHDDTFKSFFRRLTFSPDGNLLVAPSGCVESEDCRRYLNATYLYTMDSLSSPTAILPLTKQSSVAVRFCPIFFELRPEGPKPFVDLPYRMIFAVATDNDVILYDTQQPTPFAILQRIHYTRLTDLTWSADGTLLIASSTDGFCTIVTFDKGELGVPFTLEESEPEECPVDAPENEEKEKKVEKTAGVNVLQVKRKKVEDVGKPKKPNLLENWAIRNNCSETKDRKGEENGETLSGGGYKGVKETVNILQPKRKKTEGQGSSEESKIVEDEEKINILQRKRKKTEGQKTSDESKIVKEKDKINVLQPKRKKTERQEISEESKIVEDKEKINILQPKRKKTEDNVLSKEAEKINILQPKRRKTEVQVVEEAEEETFDDKECKTIKTETINILQPKRKKTEETTPSESIVKEDSPKKLEKADDEDKHKNGTTVEEKCKSINILQPKRKKAEEITSSESIVIEDSPKKLENADDEERHKNINEEEKPKKINILQPKRRKVEEKTSSELIVVEDSQKKLEKADEEENHENTNEEGKSKKVNILQPKRRKVEEKSSSELIVVEDSQKILERADEEKHKNRDEEEKSKKISILQPKRRKVEEKSSSELIVIEDSPKILEKAAEEKERNRNAEEKSKRRKAEETIPCELIVIEDSLEEVEGQNETKNQKINILQPRRKPISPEEKSKELKERNTEKTDNKCTVKTEKSKKINVLQPRRKITEERSKNNKEENAENSKPRKANILEQWAIKKPKK